jgi:putative SOS response-associated peptidase YedK
MAGVYELWKNSAAGEDEDPWMWSASVLTTTATDDLGRIHDRMPLLVEKERYDEWLDPAAEDADSLTGLLVPAAPGPLTAYPVSTDVNSVKNDSPHLVEPIALEEPTAGVAVGDEPDRLF